MPINLEPRTTGTIQLAVKGGRLRAAVLSAAEARASGSPLYVPHFANCPDSRLYRKARR